MGDKGRKLFNGVYKDRLLDSLRDELGWWDRMKLEGALTIYGNKYMPQIENEFSHAYNNHNGNIIDTLTDLKERAVDITGKKGLSHYEKPTEKAIESIINDENKREHAKIEYIDIMDINHHKTRYHHYNIEVIDSQNQGMDGSYSLDDSRAIAMESILQFEILIICVVLFLFFCLICIIALMVSRIWTHWNVKHRKYHKKEWRKICHDFDGMNHDM